MPTRCRWSAKKCHPGLPPGRRDLRRMPDAPSAQRWPGRLRDHPAPRPRGRDHRLARPLPAFRFIDHQTGEMQGVIEYLRDITERKTARHAPGVAQREGGAAPGRSTTGSRITCRSSLLSSTSSPAASRTPPSLRCSRNPSAASVPWPSSMSASTSPPTSPASSSPSIFATSPFTSSTPTRPILQPSASS